MPEPNRYRQWQQLIQAQAEVDQAYNFGHPNGHCGRTGGMPDRNMAQEPLGDYACERERRHTGPHMWRGNSVTYPFWGRGWDNMDPIITRPRIRDFTRTMMRQGDSINLSLLVNGEPAEFAACTVMAVEPSRFQFRVRGSSGVVRRQVDLWCRRQDLLAITPIATFDFPDGLR